MAFEFDLVCVGAVNVDTIVPVERVPLDDERMLSTGFLTAAGGPAATAAAAASRLGARVAFCGVVGDDEAGAAARAALEADGVDTRWLRTDPAATTARAVVITASATSGRSIITTLAPAPTPADVPLDRSPWLHADQVGYASARTAIDAAGSAIAFSIDAGNPIDGLTLRGVALFAPTVTALLARYGTDRLGDAFSAASAEGADRVVATAGATGTYVADDHGYQLVAGQQVEVVSTLGAGDVFHGALLAGLLDGRDLIAATTFANAAAALSCRQIDGRSGIPTRAQADLLLAGRP